MLLSECIGNVADIVEMESEALIEESITNVYWCPVHSAGFWVLCQVWWAEATHLDSSSHGLEFCQFSWIFLNKIRTFKNFFKLLV